MKIAVEGCAHGELDKIYETIEHLEKQNDVKIDLLICCGDFQATRNLDDLQCMAVPPKFRDICTFYKYYSGEKLAPILTIFIGGNHEASNYLQELPFGGWVAPNIYYMGYAGVVSVAGVRIAGLSGIFKGRDYCKGRYERPPYNGDTMRSCYHIRNIDVFRLKQVSNDVHICLSHDWPTGVYHSGDVSYLLKRKPFLKEEVETNSLGSRPAAEVLETLKPDFWFAAHLHVKFAALVTHKSDSEKPDKKTKFLALDKCLPKRQFLQMVDVPHDTTASFQLSYDLEWLTILQLTNHLQSVKKVNCYLPGPSGGSRWKFTPTAEELDNVRKKFPHGLEIPRSFVPTAPAYNSTSNTSPSSRMQPVMNPQTTQLCECLGIDDPMVLLMGEDSFTSDSSFNASLTSNFDTSSFVASTDSEQDSFLSPTSMRPPMLTPSPLKLPPPRGSAPPCTQPSPFRTPLKLPEPTQNADVITSTPCGKDVQPFTPLSPSPSQLPEPTFVEAHEKVEGVENVGAAVESIEPGPGPKRFRRRNIALYASNNEEC